MTLEADDDQPHGRRMADASNAEDLRILRPSSSSSSSQSTMAPAVPVAARDDRTRPETNPHHHHPNDVDERELLFLIANYLDKRAASRRAADTLKRDLAAHGLLGHSVSWDGRPRPSTFRDFKRRHGDLSADHLVQLLKGALHASASSPSAPPSLLLGRHPQLSPGDCRALQSQLVDATLRLHRLQRTEALVTRVVAKFDRLRPFLDDADVKSLPPDVQSALQRWEAIKSEDQTNDDAPDELSHALAADVRAVRQLLHVREEIRTTNVDVQSLRARASSAGALQSTVRTSGNVLSQLQRREVTMRSLRRQPPTYIYSRFRRLKTLNGHLQIPTYCMTYDKTGRVVITGADDRLIKIWSLETGHLRFTLRGHVGNITDLAVNHSNTLLASSSDDKTVRVWELSTGAPVAVLLGHSSVVNSVRFHPSRNVVVTASDDGRCFCYKLPEIVSSTEPESKQQTAKRLIDQGAYLLTLRPLYALSHASHRLNVRSNKVLCLNFSRCGNYLVTGGQDGLGRVWDVSIFSSPDMAAISEPFFPSQHPDAQALVLNEATQESEVPVLQPPVETAQADTLEGTQQQVDNANAVAPTEPTLVVEPAVGAQPAVPIDEPARQQPQLPQVPQTEHASAVPDSEIPMLPTSEPIAWLKGHTGPITNILYNYRGDMIATASIKDGTTRIWRWEKKYRKVTHTVLLAEEEPRPDADLALFYGVSSRRKVVPAVDTLAWTRDDSHLITLHSTKPDGEGADWKQRMRVWDPRSGKLLKTLAAVDGPKLHGHVNAVFAMDVHPSDARIVVTAGHDGRVIVWDIAAGRILKSFVVTSPDGDTVALLDGGFMPNGDGFCFTDRIGRLCIFGTGCGEQYSAVPVQQYFHSDYAALVTDRNFHVLDRETQQAPSLMESGPLTDIFLVRYPHQSPHLLVSRGAWTPEQYEENRLLRVEQCRESERACKVYHRGELDEQEETDEEHFPCAVLVERRKDHAREPRSPSSQLLASSAYRLNGDPVLLAELRRRMGLAQRRRRPEDQPRRRASPTLDDRDTSILNVEISSDDDDRGDEDFQAPSSRRDGDDEDDEEDEEEDDDEDEDEDELDEDDLLSESSETTSGLSRLRRRRDRPMSARSSRRGRRLGRREEADGDAMNGTENDGYGSGSPQLLRRRLRHARRPSVSEDHVDENDDDEIMLAATGNEPDGRRRTRAGSRSRSMSAETVESLGDDVVVESNDGFIVGDNQLDRFDRSVTYDEMYEAKLQQQAASNEAQVGPLIPCAFCGEGEIPGVLKLPGDDMGVHPIINGSQRLFVHDQCAIASPLCFKRAGKWYNVTKEIRRGRSLTCAECKRRGATVGCTVERCPKSYHWRCAVGCGWALDQIHFYCPQCQAARTDVDDSINATTADATGDLMARNLQQRFGLSFNRDWLQVENPREMDQYVPQVGDYVVYFPEGHQAFLKHIDSPSPPFLRLMARFHSVKCRVATVNYVFPNRQEYAKSRAIRCEISLVVLAAPSSAFSRRPQEVTSDESKEEGDSDSEAPPSPQDLLNPAAPRFSRFVGVNQHLQPNEDGDCERYQFRLHYYSNDVSSFLVLDHIFENGVSAGWKPGDRVQMPLIELNADGFQTGSKTSYGTVDAILLRNFLDSGLLSPWECVYVRWDADDEDDCGVSPWELEPVSRALRAAKRTRDRERQSTEFYRSRTFSAQQKADLVQAITDVMNLSIAKDFVEPVDPSFTDYAITVANPIDLSKIRRRLELEYYRQVDAFVADVELLHINCETYNIPTSAIAQNARSITSSVLTKVQQLFPSAPIWQERTRDSSLPPVTAFPPTDAGTNSDEYIDPVDEDDEEEIAQQAHVGEALAEPVDPMPTLGAAQVDYQQHEGTQDEPTPGHALSTNISVQVASVEEPVNEEEGSGRLSHRRQAADTRSTLAEPAVSPPRRSKRERSATTPSMSIPPVSATPSRATKLSGRKRQRPIGLRILRFDDLMEMLSAEERELFDDKTSEDLALVLHNFHEALMEADTHDIFARPVTEAIAPGYFEIIQRPMDFGTILDSIERFRHFFEYFDQISLVFENAITYNTWDSFVGGVVQDLQACCVKLLLDAIGGSSRKTKPRSALAASRAGPSASRRGGPPPKRRRGVSDDEEEEEESEVDSYFSETSSGSAVEDEEDDGDEDSASDSEDSESEESEPESDWETRKRPRRALSKARSSNKKAKRLAGKKKAAKRDQKQSKRRRRR
ncbi:hypothetical protein ATCC90586_007835 [Pythium insidiosum]|nr:hypothetical protein ATCC90586_007835 [Pythium insidiosum]